MKVLVAAASLTTLLCQPAFSQVKADEQHVYGDDPGWATFRKIVEAALVARLIDPESAWISWMSGYRKGGFKPLFEGRVHGYVACGQVNARNRMGGYTGARTFIAVVDFGRALFVEADTRARGMYADMCASQVSAGLFPPLPPEASSPTSGEEAAPVASGAGLAIRAMPEGAYVTAVTPGSAAANTGLTPGMVVGAINGIPLAGMGEAMVKVVAAAGVGATLTLVGGKSVTLQAAK